MAKTTVIKDRNGKVVRVVAPLDVVARPGKSEQKPKGGKR